MVRRGSAPAWMLTANLKNLIFPVPQTFKLFTPFKLFTVIGHFSASPSEVAARRSHSSREDVVARAPSSRLAPLLTHAHALAATVATTRCRRTRTRLPCRERRRREP
jgi:hypothetical protein